MPADQGRWGFVVNGFIINLCLGSIYSWSVFRKSLETLFDVGATQSGLPYTIFLVFFAGLMPIAGGVLEKFGPRVMAISGGSIVGLGWFLSGFATNMTAVSLCYGVIAGTGVGIAYGVPIAVGTKWFPDKKGLAVGLILVGFGLSPLITAPVSRILIELYGPLRTFTILGVSFLILIVLLSLPLRFPPNNWHPERTGSRLRGNEPRHALLDLTRTEMVKTPTFYGLWLCYIIGTFSGLMAIGISSPVGQEIIKLNAATAAVFVSIFAIFNGIGRPLFGWLTDKHTPRFTALISFIIIFLASLGMLTASEADVWLYGLCFCGFWLTLGGWLALAPAATATFFGLNDYSKKYGLVYTAYGIGAILGTVLSGELRDIFGSYKYAFIPNAILAIIGIIIATWLLKQPERKSKIQNSNGK
ncbi:MAG: OFA family MFS transporter [bacterium]|nr:OFA family MFS transporter [bacterium]